jgi:glycosyltransferase involved in cell wall biosynthesis
MKVAILSNTAPLTVGAGTSLTAVNIARYLANQDHKVHILSVSNLNEKKSIGKIEVLNFKKNILSDFSWSLLKYILTSDYDRYIAIGSSHLAFSLAMLFLKIRLMTITLIPQWHLSHAFRNPFTKFMFKLKRLLCDYPIFKLVDPPTICYTKKEELFLKKFLTETFVVSLGGLNLDRPLWKVYDKIVPQQHENSMNLLYVGMIERGKLPLYIADVLKICNEKINKKIVFYAVGPIESEYIPQLVKVLRKANVNNVVFTGPVSEYDLAKYFKNADVFVFPSVSESFGLSLVEATYAGIPVVATRTGVAPLLEKYGLILAVDCGDSKAMAEKVCLSYENSIVIRNKLRKSRSVILSNFNINRFLLSLHEIVSR